MASFFNINAYVQIEGNDWLSEKYDKYLKPFLKKHLFPQIDHHPSTRNLFEKTLWLVLASLTYAISAGFFMVSSTADNLVEKMVTKNPSSTHAAKVKTFTLYWFATSLIYILILAVFTYTAKMRRVVKLPNIYKYVLDVFVIFAILSASEVMTGTNNIRYWYPIPVHLLCLSNIFIMLENVGIYDCLVGMIIEVRVHHINDTTNWSFEAIIISLVYQCFKYLDEWWKNREYKRDQDAVPDLG